MTGTSRRQRVRSVSCESLGRVSSIPSVPSCGHAAIVTVLTESTGLNCIQRNKYGSGPKQSVTGFCLRVESGVTWLTCMPTGTCSRVLPVSCYCHFIWRLSCETRCIDSTYHTIPVSQNWGRSPETPHFPLKKESSRSVVLDLWVTTPLANLFIQKHLHYDS